MHPFVSYGASQGGSLSQLRNVWRDARFRLFVVRSTQALLQSCSASSTTDAVIIGVPHMELRLRRIVQSHE